MNGIDAMIDDEILKGRQKLLREWFLLEALAIWGAKGCDWDKGGFFEKLADDYAPVEEPRRARLVARQIYVFSAARRLGWPHGAKQIAHGLQFLFSHNLGANGHVRSAVTPTGEVVRPDYDLYDHAFVLFALAASATDPARLRDHGRAASAIGDYLDDNWRRPLGGFRDCPDPGAPLKSNPHMHLLEASLAWEETGADDGRWAALSDQIANLALERFIDARGGFLREYFDLDWLPAAGDAGKLVEPVHQFEWAWLLYRWGHKRGVPRAIAAADRLIEIGETFGVDARGVAINALNDDLTVRDANARLWPQTERIKAWLQKSAHAAQAYDRDQARARAAAGLYMMRYLYANAPGLWRETLRPDNSFDGDFGRASSLYHIVMAIDCFPEALPFGQAASSGMVGAAE